ncbi:SNF2 domain-containing protein CLASSY 3 [Morella rubra]|uniref:SNF2 domain-containing protein CLASSY 3 n=1 Tax=Morella rubra TaxID=262757 RepID=A0A6A1WXA8_9ROSI|nr:SNF2 domain-containing protein CLASSY 3 [Morella rubra]
MQIPCGILRQIINGGLDDLCQDSICDLHIDCDPLVNMLEPVWDIIPGVKSSLCPHQRYGFEFLWKNIAGGIYLDRLKNQTSFSGGSVCIVSRAPGPIVVAPCSMLLTWEEEFRNGNMTSLSTSEKPSIVGKESGLADSINRQVGPDLVK